MGKYSVEYRRDIPEKKLPKKVHPIWQGIGCTLLVLIPILSYAGAVLLVQANRQQGWLYVPPELSQAVVVPMMGYVPYLYANLLAAFVLMLLGFGILTVFFSIVYSMIGPPRYGPLDAPPERRSYRRR